MELQYLHSYPWELNAVSLSSIPTSEPEVILLEKIFPLICILFLSKNSTTDLITKYILVVR